MRLNGLHGFSSSRALHGSPSPEALLGRTTTKSGTEDILRYWRFLLVTKYQIGLADRQLDATVNAVP
jgi:hypothetical protein